MSARVRASVLSVELAKRGWSSSDLARAARMSPTTVCSALQGRPISARTLRRLAEALSRQPVIAGIEDLVEVLPAQSSSRSVRSIAS